MLPVVMKNLAILLLTFLINSNLKGENKLFITTSFYYQSMIILMTIKMDYLDDDIAQRSALLLHLLRCPSFTASHTKTFDLEPIQLVESLKFALDTH